MVKLIFKNAPEDGENKMSVEDYNSLFYKLITMEHKLSEDKRATRRAFGELLGHCATAIFRMEEVDKGNRGSDYDDEAIKRCVGFNEVFQNVIYTAKEIKEELEELIRLACKGDETE